MDWSLDRAGISSPAPHGGRGALRGGTATLDCAPVIASPGFHVFPLPDFAHVKHHVWRGEIIALDDLLDALTTDAAEHAPDLCGSHEMMHGKNHSRHATCRLTRGQDYETLVV